MPQTKSFVFSFLFLNSLWAAAVPEAAGASTPSPPNTSPHLPRDSWMVESFVSFAGWSSGCSLRRRKSASRCQRATAVRSAAHFLKLAQDWHVRRKSSKLGTNAFAAGWCDAGRLKSSMISPVNRWDESPDARSRIKHVRGEVRNQTELCQIFGIIQFFRSLWGLDWTEARLQRARADHVQKDWTWRKFLSSASALSYIVIWWWPRRWCVDSSSDCSCQFV